MTSEQQGPETESLGQLLKKTRISMGYDIEEIVEETKISASNLKAMEADAYTSLPADAFSRGFYALYAKKLKLDPDEIVARYRTERGINPRKGEVFAHNPPAHKAAQQVSNMAEPSAVSLLSTIGYILLMLIILAGGLCWYLNINPATYISEKLRSLQIEQPPSPTGPETNSNSPQPDGTTNDQGSATVSEKHIHHLSLLMNHLLPPTVPSPLHISQALPRQTG